MSTPHLTPDEFREQGHRVVDWIADYWESVDDLPVLAQVQPGDVTASLPTALPEQHRQRTRCAATSRNTRTNRPRRADPPRR